MVASQVQTWLNVMQIPFETNEDKTRFFTEWSLDGKSFKVIINVRVDGWIQITALLIESKDIPAERKLEILEHLMKDNWELDDVTYSMDKDGNIYSENDIPGHSNVETFLTELNAVVYGAKRFFSNFEDIIGIEKPSVLN
ncbi:MAG: hypothetical protein GF411_00570 [Candidatus Lokiarchaeota archaeon]|nr:hypothetical protein [Candidatus Lokiarchaeota archaeon]